MSRTIVGTRILLLALCALLWPASQAFAQGVTTDTGVMLYTSGTTAMPKGCPLTHEALVRTITDEVVGAVDVNPHKWGKFMVGSHHEILAPTSLVTLRPDLVVAMNPIYLDEIGADLDRMGLRPELIPA